MSVLLATALERAVNVQAIDRRQIETLATGEFIRRGDNLVIAGQSGVGKSRTVQSVGRAACAQGYRVRYTTSAELLRDLTASLADHSLHERLRHYSNFDLLAIDEFGFDRIERIESGQAGSLLYKVVDNRGPRRSTALVTNISFEAWAGYLGDAPLAMAILDRLVDGAIGAEDRRSLLPRPSRLLCSARLPDRPATPAIDLAILRSQVPIEQVLTLLGFVPSRRNDRWLRGPCPIHQSGRPQSRDFWVDLATHRYRCFKCHSAGHQLDLWAAADNRIIESASPVTKRTLKNPSIRLVANLTPN